MPRCSSTGTLLRIRVGATARRRRTSSPNRSSPGATERPARAALAGRWRGRGQLVACEHRGWHFAREPVELIEDPRQLALECAEAAAQAGWPLLGVVAVGGDVVHEA